MTKKELVKSVAEKANVSIATANSIVNAVFETITEGLKTEDVTIPGFGTFASVEVEEKTGVVRFGSKKGETYVTPAHRAAKFKPGKTLKDTIR